MSIRILLADDQPLFREGLATLLTIQAEIEVVGEANNGQEAVALAAERQPDVILMDVRMPVLDGVAATRILRQEQPHIPVIILTTFDDDELLFEGLRAGAIGYLLKDVSSQKLIEAIKTAVRGETFLQPSVAARLVAEFNRLSQRSSAGAGHPLVEPLSERELEILRELAKGASNREIAAQLFIAEGTVKNHVTNILGKLDVRDRTQAVLKAQQLGLI